MANNKQINNNKDGIIKRTVKKMGFNWPVSGAGNVLGGSAIPQSGFIPVPDQNYVRVSQPFKTDAPTKRLDRTTGYSQIQNLSKEFTLEKVQGAIRSAESGDTRMYFAYLRDFILGNSMVMAELGKRKLSTLSEPYIIMPRDKNNADDKIAAEVITEALDHCPTFLNSLVSLQNAVVYPVAVCEKILPAIDDPECPPYGVNKYNLRYRIKELPPVDYNNITYRLPYIPQFYSTHTNVVPGNPNLMQGSAGAPIPPLTAFNSVGDPEDVIYDPDSWEPNLRFWQVLPNGIIIQSPATLIRPDPMRHIVYRCDLATNIARENFGGLGKSLLFLSIMSQLGLDVFLRCLQKYGLPFINVKSDTAQVDTVNQIIETFGNMSTVVNAIAVNKDAAVELTEMNYSGAADAHSKFLSFIHDQISLLISGQTLGSNAKSTGLGSGVADLHAAVREDIIKYDRVCLSNCLEHQLFRQYLNINGIDGATPKIVWGGNSTAFENKDTAAAIYSYTQSGGKITDEGWQIISEKIGIPIVSNGGDNDNGKQNISNLKKKVDDEKEGLSTVDKPSTEEENDDDNKETSNDDNEDDGEEEKE